MLRNRHVLVALLLVFAGHTARAQVESAAPDLSQVFSESKLSGDWFGARSSLAEEGGVTFDLYSTQYYQGVTRGGLERDFEFGGRLDYLLNVDGHTAGLWQGSFLNLHAETRYGTDINPIDGLLAPSNTAMSFPTPDQHLTSITGLKFTQALSENFVVYGGKINTLDEFPLRYGKTWGGGPPALLGFQSMSLVFNPIAARTVPYSTGGIGFAFLADLKPVFAVTFLDPEERSDKGLEHLYARGVTIVPDLVLEGEFLGGPALLNIGGAYGTADYRTLDPAAYLNLLLLGDLQAAVAAGGPVESGSWSIYANGYQSLWVDPDEPGRNWGVFGCWGLSDGNPNPIHYTLAIGIGGRSMLPDRDLDVFGVGFYYLGLSDELKRLTALIQPQQDEYGAELFYNLALTPWCRLTPNVQVGRPSTRATDTMLATGIRLQLIF